MENEGLRGEVSSRLDSNPVLNYHPGGGERECLPHILEWSVAAAAMGQPLCKGPLPLPSGLAGTQFRALRLSVLGGRDAVRCWGKKRFRVSISDSDLRSWLCPPQRLGLAFWKPLPDVSSGAEEVGFQTDYFLCEATPSKNDHIGCTCTFTYLVPGFLSGKNYSYFNAYMAGMWVCKVN